MKHTPGPWTIRPEKPCTVNAIYRNRDNPLPFEVCPMVFGQTGDEATANASLISASVDLFSELALIVDSEWGERFENDEDINGGDLVEFMAERWPHIKAAVEKARGE